jgi:hypothetical protein
VNPKRYTTPSVVLFTFGFLFQFLAALYELRQLETPWPLDLLSRIAFVWLVWWWLRDDSRRRGITWALDLGMLLFAAWIVVLPYHLFKTRGLKAFIPVLAYILVVLCGSVAATITTVLFFS